MSGAKLGYALVILGVAFNNLVYLQDLWLGQPSITLDSWRAILGILIGIGLVVIGLVMIARSADSKA
jgi:hypothetical protein